MREFLVVVVLLLAAPASAWAQAEYTLDTDDQERKSWFSLGEKMACLIPPPDLDKNASTVTCGEQTFELPHQVTRVKWNDRYCVLAGGGKLTCFELKPSLKLLFTRDLEGTKIVDNIDLKLTHYDIKGCSMFSNTAWGFSIDGKNEWKVTTRTIEPTGVLLVRNDLFYVADGDLFRPGIDSFEPMEGDSGLEWGMVDADVTYAVEGTIVFLLSGGKVATSEIKKTLDGPVIKPVAEYEAIYSERFMYLRSIKLDETYVFLTDSEFGECHVMELDVLKERYRKVKIDKTKKGYGQLFIHGKDFYSSVDVEQGAVLKGEELEKAKWVPLKKIEEKKP